MLFTTTTQYVALAVALVAGWLLGLASHPGGRRWKERYAEEREAHATARREHDARVAEEKARTAELERENARLATAAPAPVAREDSRGAELNARIAELERENARLARAVPGTPATVAPLTAAPTSYPETRVISPSRSTDPTDRTRD